MLIAMLVAAGARQVHRKFVPKDKQGLKPLSSLVALLSAHERSHVAFSFSAPRFRPSMSSTRSLSSPPAYHQARRAISDPRMEGANSEARELTAIDYGKTVGLALIPIVVGYYVLTTVFGFEQNLALGVEVSLVAAVNAYLFYIDKKTQAGVKRDMRAEIAWNEANAIIEAPKAKVKVFSASDAIESPVPVVSALDIDGYLRLNQVLKPETAKDLLQHIEARLEEKRKEALADLASETANFGNVLMRENRWDLMLDLDPPVRAAVKEIMEPLTPVFGGLLGPDAELFEMATVIADPGAPRQPMHPDTSVRLNEGAIITTCFVALQDVDEDMGPTVFIPRTNTAGAHIKFADQDDGRRQANILMMDYPNHLGVLKTGDANLFESRLFHAGTKNKSNKRRVLFYLSFRQTGAASARGSLLRKFWNSGYTLANQDEWVQEPDSEPVASDGEAVAA